MIVKQVIPFIFYIALTITSFGVHGQYVCKSLNSADAELNKLYKEILRTYAEDSLFILKLKKAHGLGLHTVTPISNLFILLKTRSIMGVHIQCVFVSQSAN